MSEFDAERGELFLADVAVLVEGRTEKLALPHVFRVLGVDVDREGISVIECGGKANLAIFVRLCQATGVPFGVVHDRDARSGRDPSPSERRINQALRSLAGQSRVIELTPDFEGVAGLRRHTHKPEQAWRHFRNWPPAMFPMTSTGSSTRPPRWSPAAVHLDDVDDPASAHGGRGPPALRHQPLRRRRPRARRAPTARDRRRFRGPGPPWQGGVGVRLGAPRSRRRPL